MSADHTQGSLADLARNAILLKTQARFRLWPRQVRGDAGRDRSGVFCFGSLPVLAPRVSRASPGFPECSAFQMDTIHSRLTSRRHHFQLLSEPPAGPPHCLQRRPHTQSQGTGDWQAPRGRRQLLPSQVRILFYFTGGCGSSKWPRDPQPNKYRL